MTEREIAIAMTQLRGGPAEAAAWIRRHHGDAAGDIADRLVRGTRTDGVRAYREDASHDLRALLRERQRDTDERRKHRVDAGLAALPNSYKASLSPAERAFPPSRRPLPNAIRR